MACSRVNFTVFGKGGGDLRKTGNVGKVLYPVVAVLTREYFVKHLKFELQIECSSYRTEDTIRLTLKTSRLVMFRETISVK